MRDWRALAPFAQRGLRMIYPPQCLTCKQFLDQEHALCPQCWAQTPFITALCCDACGTPLPGHEEEAVLCDQCLRHPPPWAKGRAALAYDGLARDLILRLKHGDRLDLARVLGAWMTRAGTPFLTTGAVLVPIPLHWTRLARRRYNQSAALAQRIGQLSGLSVQPDLLQRTRRTPPQEGKSRQEREENLHGAFRIHPRHLHGIKGMEVVLIDDVMTSGATFKEAAHLLTEAGAAKISVLALARVTPKDWS